MSEIDVLASAVVEMYAKLMTRVDMTLNLLLPLSHECDRCDDQRCLASGVCRWITADESQSLYLETLLAMDQ